MLCTLDFNATLVLRCNYSINNTKYQRTGIIQYFKVTQSRVRNEFMDSSSSVMKTENICKALYGQ